MPAEFLYLASGSPRRRELLQQIGVSFRVLGTGVDETALPDEAPAAYVARLAAAKAEAGWRAVAGVAVRAADTAGGGAVFAASTAILAADTAVLAGDTAAGDAEFKADTAAGVAVLAADTAVLAADTAVLAADTAVVIDGGIIGKPADRADGERMLLRLSGRTHEVLTAVALRSAHALNSRLSRSEVTFRHIGEGEARAYWETGEPADKAGGYAIQGRAAVFVAHLRGSYSGVMGLPLFETAELLEQAGVWRRIFGSGP